MRTNAQYPLADDELIAYCEREKAKLAGPDATFGGMQYMILCALIERVRENPRSPSGIPNQATTPTQTTTAKD